MKTFLQRSVLLYVVVTALVFLLASRFPILNLTWPPLIYGNTWLFGITLLAFYLEIKGVRSSNTYAFFRYVYMGLMLKLFLSIGVVVLYALANRAVLTRGVVLIWLFLYIGYTWIEVSLLVRAGKPKA